MNDNFTLARSFAKLMDENKFAEFGAMIAVDCRYRFRGKVIEGRAAIVKTYHDNYFGGLHKLDEINFSSDVEAVSGDEFTIKFLDKLRSGRLWHEHRCEQRLRIQAGQIVEIEHVDLPGEVESLNTFFKESALSY